MPTRIVNDIIHTPLGEPWAGFQVNFTLTPTVAALHATLPYRTVSATTGDDGTFAVELETGVQYLVDLYSAFERVGRSTSYPGKTNNLPIVIPEGDTPIALRTLLASAITPPDDPTLADFVANHLADVDNLIATIPGEITAQIANDANVIAAAEQAAQSALYALADGIDGGYPSTVYDGGIVADGGTP